MKGARAVFALVIVGLLAGLTAVVYADPLDPPIPGFWNNDDWDTVVAIITGSNHALPAPILVDVGPPAGPIVWIETLEPHVGRSAPKPSREPRAPPVVPPISR